MFTKSITIVLTMLFILYSNSISVVWMLYYYEKEDIILYFCPYDSQNGGDGVCFIQKMMDENHNSSNAKTTAPRILISSNTTVYLPTSHKIPVVLPQSPTHAVDCEIPLQFGFYPSVFRPPLV